MSARVFLASSLAVFAVSASAHSALVYGGGSQTSNGLNAGANVIAYMNCFTPIAEAWQTQLSLTDVVVGINRRLSAGQLVGVGFNVYAAEMTFDGTTYGRGENTFLFSKSLSGGSGSAGTFLEGSPNGLSGIVLDLETSSVAGFGGWWIGIEFTGPNAANAANRWRVVGAPTTGFSNNSYATFNNNTGIFNPSQGFGSPPGSQASRMLVNVEGSLVPAPSVLGLLGLVGLTRRRRR